MKLGYLNIIIDSGPLIASIVSLILFFFSFFKPLLKNILWRLSLLFLVLTSLISFEFYPFQISVFPINLIIPVGIMIVCFLKIKGIQHQAFIGIMTIIFSLYLVFGLSFLSSSSTTWGSGSAVLGIFIVPNSLMILISLFSIQKNSFNLFIICKFFVALGGFTLLYYSTDGFYYGEYDGDDVKLRRDLSIFICVISLIESLLIYLQKKHLLTTYKNNKG